MKKLGQKKLLGRKQQKLVLELVKVEIDLEVRGDLAINPKFCCHVFQPKSPSRSNHVFRNWDSNLQRPTPRAGSARPSYHPNRCNKSPPSQAPPSRRANGQISCSWRNPRCCGNSSRPGWSVPSYLKSRELNDHSGEKSLKLLEETTYPNESNEVNFFQVPYIIVNMHKPWGKLTSNGVCCTEILPV